MTSDGADEFRGTFLRLFSVSLEHDASPIDIWTFLALWDGGGALPSQAVEYLRRVGDAIVNLDPETHHDKLPRELQSILEIETKDIRHKEELNGKPGLDIAIKVYGKILSGSTVERAIGDTREELNREFGGQSGRSAEWPSEQTVRNYYYSHKTTLDQCRIGRLVRGLRQQGLCQEEAVAQVSAQQGITLEQAEDAYTIFSIMTAPPGFLKKGGG